MTDRELLLKAQEILFDVAVRKRSGVTDDGAAFVPFETLLACADMTQAIEAHIKYPPQQAEEQEPACWVTPDNEGFRMRLSPPLTDVPLKWLPLYTAPPQREWVGLTDEEYEATAEQNVTNCYFDTLKYASAIEAKLKEKNT